MWNFYPSKSQFTRKKLTQIQQQVVRFCFIEVGLLFDFPCLTQIMLIAAYFKLKTVRNYADQLRFRAKLWCFFLVYKLNVKKKEAFYASPFYPTAQAASQLHHHVSPQTSVHLRLQKLPEINGAHCHFTVSTNGNKMLDSADGAKRKDRWEKGGHSAGNWWRVQTENMAPFLTGVHWIVCPSS